MRARRTEKRLYLGWSPSRGNPRPWEHFPVPHLMVNALDLSQRLGRECCVRTHLGFDGEIFCDSGGFQVISRRKTISPGEALKLQDWVGAPLNATLDDPLRPERHLANFKTYLDYANANPGFGLVPVIPHDLHPRRVRSMAELCPRPQMIAIGKVVPSIFPLHKPDPLRRVLQNIDFIRGCFPQSRVHVLGVGGAATSLLFLSIVDSVDSSSWLHDARFGKIRCLGGGLVDPRKPSSYQPERATRDCRCPICKAAEPVDLTRKDKQGFQARAIHNAWVRIAELKAFNHSLTEGRQDRFILRRLSKSNWHRGLLDVVQSRDSRQTIRSAAGVR